MPEAHRNLCIFPSSDNLVFANSVFATLYRTQLPQIQELTINQKLFFLNGFQWIEEEKQSGGGGNGFSTDLTLESYK